MIIYYIEKESIDYIKSKWLTFLPCFNEDTNESFLKKWEETTHKPLFKETRFGEFPDFTLPPGTSEVDAVKLVYGNLATLDETSANFQDVWAGLCIKYFWPYTKARWMKDKSITVDIVNKHFFFEKDLNRESFSRNAISRLWWIGKFTYDEEHTENPWWLTELIAPSSDQVASWIERSISNNLTVTRALGRAIIDVRAQGKEVNTIAFRAISKYINILSGSYIIDCMSEDRLKNKIQSELEKIVDTSLESKQKPSKE